MIYELIEYQMGFEMILKDYLKTIVYLAIINIDQYKDMSWR